MHLHARFVVDAAGHRRAIQLPLHEFKRLVELLEDIEDIAYVKAHRRDRLIPMAKVHTALKS